MYYYSFISLSIASRAITILPSLQKLLLVIAPQTPPFHSTFPLISSSSPKSETFITESALSAQPLMVPNRAVVILLGFLSQAPSFIASQIIPSSPLMLGPWSSKAQAQDPQTPDPLLFLGERPTSTLTLHALSILIFPTCS